MRYIPPPGFVCKSHCRPLSRKVSLSWLPCSAAEKQMGEQIREGAGGVYANEMLTDPATITNHQSDLISWLTDWMSVWLGTYQANPPQLQPLFQHQPLSTYTTQSLGVHHWTTTVGGICWLLFPDMVWNGSKISLEAQRATILTWRQKLRAYSPCIC